MELIREVILEELEKDRPMTVRQMFYRLVSLGVIEKTESEYKGTVVRLLTEMRRNGLLPYSWIADNTRWMRKPETWDGLSELLNVTAEAYRRALWVDMPAYVEIWLEKEALAGVLYDATENWDVPLMVTRGYPSLSFVYSAAETIQQVQKPVFIYYFGDYDPSGVDIPRVVEERLREFAPDAEIHFEIAAVTPEQIEDWNLPTRPTKRSDTRSKSFRGQSVEVDAIPPSALRELAGSCITQHVDEGELNRLLCIEHQERALLRKIASNLN